MADENKKSSLVDKIGLWLDKTLTFGGSLSGYDSSIINSVEKEMGVDSWKDINNQADFDEFKVKINALKNKGDSVSKGKNGGAVMKMKSGGMATKRNKPASRSNKPIVAGRLASRGYGKAFKGK